MVDDFLDISVSIVTFNNSDVLKNRLEILLPIFKENGVNKLIIVDSASTDKTQALLKDFASVYPMIDLILLSQNRGFGYGHNMAIREVTSQYHIVMNLDTTPNQRNSLIKMSQYMNVHPDVDLLSPLVRYPNGDIQYLTRNEPTVFDLGIRLLGSTWFKNRQEKFVHLEDGYDHEQKILNATGSFMFLRTETLQRIGGFDERYFLYMEDTDLTKTINENGKAMLSPEFEVIHEWQRGNHSVSGSKIMISSMIKYFNKWGWRLW